MSTVSDDSLAALLSELEDLELPLLQWGVTDGFISQGEVFRLIDDRIIADLRSAEREVPSSDEYLSALLSRGLLLRVPGGAPPRYRTRLGELLRLLRTLRQLFPPRDENVPQWWRSGNPLVSDFRLKVGPRRYPDRSVGRADVVARLSAVPGWLDSGGRVVSALLGERSLAEFQVDAAASILAAIDARSTSARIVTAGTGSGKTLAFYLPALIDAARRSGLQATRGVHTLALYPRNELLRDQAREALASVMKVNAAQGVEGTNPLTVGVLYGSTPWNVSALERNSKMFGWELAGNGLVCPYFPCPVDGCGGDLVWSEADRKATRERLTCARCGLSTDGILPLTRESLISTPPTLLFSTTEMLARNATHPRLAPLLGWRGGESIRLMLLDEAHTYAGVHGAQVGLLLRRWRQAKRGPVVYVGLSATLRDAATFMSDLVGLDRRYVDDISPLESQMLTTSREYSVVLRGDAVSGSSLLSTTIQTVMAGARHLDRQPGIFGSAAFVFTDDLDVNTRLHDDLESAEAPWHKGRTGPPLADLRDPTRAQQLERFVDGQSWEIPYVMGRVPGRLKVSRTSSLDTGVDRESDVVVATSSLEVGFNDPRVGLVIQHKAPRDAASFLQRRGRAGRTLAMRPMTVVVLSDYGRDRVAYQTYERLLDPEVERKHLPVANRFVLKMHAAHSLIDWVSRVEGLDGRAVLTPSDHTQDPAVINRLVHRCIALLEEEDQQAQLRQHLRWSLQVSDDEAQALMWEEPRSLIFSVIPTILRRLEGRWRTLPGTSDPGAAIRAPLPEFMTVSLFESLSTPEVRFELPGRMQTTTPPVMAIGAALREAVPGRVSRRYGVGHASHRTWLPLPDPAAGGNIELGSFVAAGHAQGVWTSASQDLFVVRPFTITLSEPPRDIADSSNARPRWRSEFILPDAGVAQIDIPDNSGWQRLVTGAGFALHALGNPLRVRRMAVGADAQVVLETPSGLQRSEQSVTYTHQGKPAALGFELDVDAMTVTASIPADLHARLGQVVLSPAWRTTAFRTRVMEDRRLDGLANRFQREWLAELYLYSMARIGTGDTTALDDGKWADPLEDFLRTAYRSDSASAAPQRLIDGLRQLTVQAAVREAVEAAGDVLVATLEADATDDLLRRALADTLAAALLAVARRLVPDAQEADLVADVRWEGDEDFLVILSESSMGSLGLLEALRREYVRDPRGFWSRVLRETGPSEYESVDEALRRVIDRLTSGDSQWIQAVANFRRAETAKAQDEALAALIALWSSADGFPDHLLMSTFASRVLRQGSSEETEAAIAQFIVAWDQLERSTGAEVDARVVASLVGQGFLGSLPGTYSSDVVLSLLWLRGTKARNQHLDHWQPYVDDRLVERLVLHVLCHSDYPLVDVTEPTWDEAYLAAITTYGTVLLQAPTGQRSAIGKALRQVAVTPIERDAIRVYGRLVEVVRDHVHTTAQISVAEDLQ